MNESMLSLKEKKPQIIGFPFFKTYFKTHTLNIIFADFSIW